MPIRNLSGLRELRNTFSAFFSATIIVFFLWAILSKSLPAGLSQDAPSISLYLNPSISSITLDTVDQVISRAQLNESETDLLKKDITGSREQPRPRRAEKVSSANLSNLVEGKKSLISLIQREPTSAMAFRQLGQIAVLDNQAGLAGRMMFQSTKLSLHDPLALYEMLSRSLKAKKYSSAIYYADAFLRSFPGSYSVIAPIMMEIITNDQSRPLLVKALADNPPWRATVLNSSYATAGLKDVQAPLKLLIGLNETDFPPQLKELAGYINFLFQNQQYELAYSTWLLFLPVELMDQTGLVFNGSFETDPTGLIFDWTIGKGSEVEAGITSHPDNDSARALFVEFGVGRTKFPLLRQTIFLTPGGYQLSYLVKGEMMGRRGLEWQIICENGKQADEGKTIIGRFQSWRRIDANITIPKEGCRYQYLRLAHLARSASEQMAHGQLWFDEITIQRQSNTPNNEP